MGSGGEGNWRVESEQDEYILIIMFGKHCCVRANLRGGAGSAGLGKCLQLRGRSGRPPFLGNKSFVINPSVKLSGGAWESVIVTCLKAKGPPGREALRFILGLV